MKSSKIENVLTLNTKTDEVKTLSPLTYYQPFQSSFDPEFTTSTIKSNGRRELLKTSMRKWKQAPDISTTVFRNSERMSVWEKKGHPKSCVFDSAYCSEKSGSSGNVYLASGYSPFTWKAETEKMNNGTDPRTKISSVPCSFSEKRNPLHTTANPYVLCSSSSPMCCYSTDFSSLPCRDNFPASVFAGNKAPNARTTLASKCETSGCAPPCNPQIPSPQSKGFLQIFQKSAHSRPMICNFCKNNKEVPDIYLNHYLYDPETKVLTCPVLRKHVCEICGGTGDRAHTLQYCPINRERGLQAKVPVLLKTRTITNSTGKIRRN